MKRSLQAESMAFLKMVVNMPWRDVQQFPIHIYFATLFSRLDAVVRRLGMASGYGHYLLASSRFRETNALRPMHWIVAEEFDSLNLEEENGGNAENGENRQNGKIRKLTESDTHGLVLDIEVFVFHWVLMKCFRFGLSDFRTVADFQILNGFLLFSDRSSSRPIG